MLSFDMEGRLIEPSRLKKTLGGDFDTRGIPPLFEIPTTGDHAGVTVADYASDPYLAKTLSRTTPGPALVHGPTLPLEGEHVGFCLRSRVFGGGSSATSGSTRRDFTLGLQSADGQHGLFMEYLNPDRAVTGAFITGRAAGVDTRKPVQFQVNNPAERYPVELWVTRNVQTGGWSATLCEGAQPRHVVEFSAAEASLTSFQPMLGWDWTYTSGTFSAQLAHLSLDIYWRF